MFYLNNISLNFGDRKILDQVTAMFSDKDVVGLIGRNGTGKSTLLKVIAGDIACDKGAIDIPKNAEVGYLRQFLPTEKEISIIDETCKAFEDYMTLEKEIVELESSMTNDLSSDALTKILEELEEKQIQQQSFPFKNPKIEAIKLLKGLGFKDDQMDDPIASLSGGWQMRIELAKLLLRQPALLLLDEPTNHLDIESIIWFESYIKKYPGAVILVSHDEDFLANTTNRIIEIQNGKIEDYRLPYRKFLTEKESRREILKSQFVNQQKLIKEKERTITRFKAKATKTSMAQSMEKQLAKMERVEYEEPTESNMRLRFPFEGRCGEVVFEAKDLAKSYGDNQVFKNVSIKFLRGDKVAFIGQNGMGKSTLTKIIQQILEPTQGEANQGYNVVTAYYDQDQSEALDGKLSVLETATQSGYHKTSAEIRSTLGAFMFSGEDVDKKVGVLSGGEKARLALACMTMHPANLIILDEPTNHLDIYAKKVLKNALASFEGNLLVVSHDREFLRGLSTKTFEFVDGKIIEHLGDLEYVLNKRASDDLRDYAHQKTEKQTNKLSTDNKPKMSFDERKKLNRQLTYLERDIEKLEAEIKSFQSTMAEASFYQQADANQLMADHKAKEKLLVDKTNEWERICDVLA